jgi:anaerobic dimethyl sulfoxide reductase subunit A
MEQQGKQEAKIIPIGCDHDCGGRCVLKAHVQNSVIVAVETDDGEEPQLRACARGRALRQMVYAPDRLKFPLKRIGTRGEGKFERISWDEALDTVASEMRRIKETYGPSAILYLQFAGMQGVVQRNAVLRLLNMFGGCTTTWGTTSCEAANVSDEVTYGTLITGHTRDDLLNSRLIILWGWNPANTIFVTNTPFYLAKAKEAGIKIICIDPRFTDTVATFADQWIPIRPTTDTAMLIAMAYVIIKENLQDQHFLDTYTIGFDKFKDYVLGMEDGIPKTPAWAEGITGVPETVIENLAREYATSKPAALLPGWAPGRIAYGEQFHRAASTLAAMTGNVGVHGGNPAGTGFFPVGVMVGPRLPTGDNPVEKRNPYPAKLDAALRNRVRVPVAKVFDAILRGRSGGYPADIKMIYSVCGNPLNQMLNINKGVEALRRVEFIVVHEIFITPTAKFADILLPVSTCAERNDLLRPWMSGPYYIYANKAIDSLHESKSDFEICVELAPRLGILSYSDKTEDEWVRDIIEHADDASKYPIAPDAFSQRMAKYFRDIVKDIPDFKEFRKKGYHKIPLKEPVIAFKEQIEDPEANPFPTPSGKIEIYSQQWADLNNPELPPIPKYIEPWEGLNDPLIKKYPLQLITNHYKTRAHSSLNNLPWLRELEPQRVWINPVDAKARDISDWDDVRIFNDRGQSILPAKVTETILPGVVFMGEGAWYSPDEKGIDRGGCPNVLTKDEYSPAGAFCCNTCLVQVEKA